MGVPVYTELAPEGGDNRPGTKREIRYIVIHETGNPAEGADAAAHGRLQANGGEGKTGWHYTVDDHEIWHSFPDDEVAYHAGDGRDGDGNLYGIGVELCVNADGDFEMTFDNAAKLTGWLMHTYHLSRTPSKNTMISLEKTVPRPSGKQAVWQNLSKRPRHMPMHWKNNKQRVAPGGKKAAAQAAAFPFLGRKRGNEGKSTKF